MKACARIAGANKIAATTTTAIALDLISNLPKRGPEIGRMRSRGQPLSGGALIGRHCAERMTARRITGSRRSARAFELPQRVATREQALGVGIGRNFDQ